MANVHDVAAYILGKQGSMTAMKLQKLCYYSQAWHLVWESKPMFNAKIEAWANGPVIPKLYEAHRGQFMVSSWPKGNADNLKKDEVESESVVLGAYGGMSAFELSELTHRELPWRDARQGLGAGERGNAEITPSALVEYYEALLA